MIRQWLASLILALAVLCVPLSAQENAEVDYRGWDSFAAAQEARVADAQGLDAEQLLAIRTRVTAWRDQFLSAQTVNDSAIASLQAQLDGLGPPPEDGAPPEAEETAAQRMALTADLEKLRAPQRSAAAAYSRADALIAQIDRLQREREARRLMTRGPSPLNPANWPDAGRALTTGLGETQSELHAAVSDPEKRARANRNAPLTLALFGIGLILLLRGRHWAEARTQRIVDERSLRPGREVAIFAASLLQILLPALGVLMLIWALNALGLAGERIELLFAFLTACGVAFFAARWLAMRVLRLRSDAPTLTHDPEDLVRGRRLFGLAAVVSVLVTAADIVSQFPEFNEAARAVLVAPGAVILAALLYRIGTKLRRMGRSRRGESDTGALMPFTLAAIGQGTRVAAIVGAVLMLAGYTNGALALLLPLLSTLVLFGVLWSLHLLMRDLYGWLKGTSSEEAGDALLPVLASLCLTLAALPVLALIWGVRAEELAEVWLRFRQGFTLGDTRISPGTFATILMVFLLGLGVTRVVQGTLRATVLPRTRLDQGARSAITSGIGYVGIFIAALSAITAAGLNLSSLAIVAGALSVGIGFGLQNIVSNFVSGIILLIERPISEGDWIEVNGHTGFVRRISVRSTRVETFDRTDVIVPNADFVSGTVTNWTRHNLTGRVIVPVSVAYGSDTKQVEEILRSVAEDHPLVVVNPEPTVLFMNFGESGLDFEIRAILRDVNWVLSAGSDMRHDIARRFAAEGIEMPFPQRDIWLRNPEALSVSKPSTAPRPERDHGSDQAHLTVDDLHAGEAGAEDGD